MQEFEAFPSYRKSLSLAQVMVGLAVVGCCVGEVVGVIEGATET